MWKNPGHSLLETNLISKFSKKYVQNPGSTNAPPCPSGCPANCSPECHPSCVALQMNFNNAGLAGSAGVLLQVCCGHVYAWPSD